MTVNKSYVTALLLLLATFIFHQCDTVSHPTENSSKNELKKWELIIETGITDTSFKTYWFPESELSLEYRFLSDSSCSSPRFEFYPIQYDTFIEGRLARYLYLQSQLIPPYVNTYVNDDYFVIGWNLTSFGENICCNCEEIIKELQGQYHLQEKDIPFVTKLNEQFELDQ